MLGLLALMFFMFALASTGAPRVAFVGLFIGIAFVAFWVVVLRSLIGFGRWLMQMPPDRPRRAFSADRPGRPRSPESVRTCADPRCGRVNLAEARYCARCGRPLGQAA
jgi:hypothetical protein